MAVQVLHGDCLAILPTLAVNSVDAVVTDPPYGLEFMGKEWDKFTPSKFQTWCEAWATECLRVLKPGGHLVAFGGSRTYHRLACGIEDAGFEIRDQLQWLYGQGFPKHKSVLKPGHEPIVLARKPMAGTVAANVLRWGTGALNIDGCRVGFASEADRAESTTKNQHAKFGSGARHNKVFGADNADRTNYNPPGRWPANVIHDGSQMVLGMFPDAAPASNRPRNNGDFKSVAKGQEKAHVTFGHSDNGGSAARFFYCAKASKTERAGSKHPTVKPTALMQWLASLVTPTGGMILDPFAGSGTTGIAANHEGFDCILIEREADYVADIGVRLETNGAV